MMQNKLRKMSVPIFDDSFVLEVAPGDFDVLQELFDAECVTVMQWGDMKVEIEGRVFEYAGHVEIDGRDYVAVSDMGKMIAGLHRVEEFLDVSLNVSI
jgi:hypothetical protein